MTKTSDPFDPSASEVIDVRAPAEYQVDHIPGNNLLSNDKTKTKQKNKNRTKNNDSPLAFWH